MGSLANRLLAFGLTATVLSGCAQLANDPHRRAVAIDQLLAQGGSDSPPRESIDPTLLELLAAPAGASAFVAPPPAQPRFDAVVSGMDARAFFLALANDSKQNVVVHPEVSGTIDLNLRHVTLEETLSAVARLYGYTIERQGNTFFVFPPRLETRTYPLHYLNIRRSGGTSLSVSSSQLPQVGSGSSATLTPSTTNPMTEDAGASRNAPIRTGSFLATDTAHDFWHEIASTLCLLINLPPPAPTTATNNEGVSALGCQPPVGQSAPPAATNGAAGANTSPTLPRAVVVSPLSGTALVRALPAEHELIERFLQRAQSAANQQVVLEAKILEVELNDGFQSGIDWMKLANWKNGKWDITLAQSGDKLPMKEGFTGFFSAVVSGADFSLFIDLLGTQGNVQVLSSPRVATLNNQKAVIKVGTDEYFVTRVSATTTTTTGTGTTTTPNIELTPLFSGVALDVTPRIENDEIVLHIRPLVSEINEKTKTFRVFGQEQTLPLPQSRVRETDTMVRAKDGQIIVIGGLMQDKGSNESAQVPVLGDLPVFGELFRHRRNRALKSELVILLRPIVVKQTQTWDELREEIRQRHWSLWPTERGPQWASPMRP